MIKYIIAPLIIFLLLAFMIQQSFASLESLASDYAAHRIAQTNAVRDVDVAQINASRDVQVARLNPLRMYYGNWRIMIWLTVAAAAAVPLSGTVLGFMLMKGGRR